MKCRAVVVVALTLALSLPGVAAADTSDWLFTWHVDGDMTGPPYSWDYQGQSPATLTRRADLDAGYTAIYHPDGPVWELHYTWGNQTLGGLVAEGRFQFPASGNFTVPSPIGPWGTVTGGFSLQDDRFALETFGPLGHNRATLTGTGERIQTGEALEPGSLVLAVLGLAAAVLVRRRHRSL